MGLHSATGRQDLNMPPTGRRVSGKFFFRLGALGTEVARKIFLGKSPQRATRLRARFLAVPELSRPGRTQAMSVSEAAVMAASRSSSVWKPP